MWWWGVCAGASCSTAVALEPAASTPGSTSLRRRRAPLYEDLRALSVDGAKASASVATADGRAHVLPGVYTARHALTQELVAVKVLPRALLRDRAARRRLRRELRVLRRCRSHPNLLRLHGVHASSSATVELAFELAKGGEVMNRLLGAGAASSGGGYRFSEAEVSRVVAACAAGLAFLHDQKILHGELRPEHVLYSDAEPDARVLLVGFGRAAPWRQLSLRATSSTATPTGPASFLWEDQRHMRFLPPYILRRKRRLRQPAEQSGCCTWDDGTPAKRGEVDEANLVMSWSEAQQVDIWALGVIAFMLLCGEYPFAGNTAEDTISALSLKQLESRILRDGLSFPAFAEDDDTEETGYRSSGFAPALTRAAKDFLLQILEKDPEKAMNIHEVLAHPWIQDQVANDIPWSNAEIAKHQRFAVQYSMEVAASRGGNSNISTSGKRRPTLGIEGYSAGEIDDPLQFRTRSVDDDDIEATGDYNGAGRPSYVSTDGQELYLSEEEQQRPSAEGYMRIADDEMDQAVAQRDLPKRGKDLVVTEMTIDPISTSTGGRYDDDFDPSYMSPRAYMQAGRQPSLDKMWQVLIRQRRFFSFKSLSSSFNSSGKASDTV